MNARFAAAAASALLAASAGGAGAQTPHHPSHGGHASPAPADTTHGAREGHDMWTAPLGGGWTLAGMAQVFPALTAGAPNDAESPLNTAEVYATQPALMLNLESPGSRLALRTTLNFEGVTQEEGELTFGGWGEAFIDKRHPHTLLHEAMLSVNFWSAPGGSLSLSAGRGFAPYGTEDPMSRPVLKFPTNHHLSQLPERWTLNGVYALRTGTVLEAGVFGGSEPEGPYDLSNLESFGDSWAARVTQRLARGTELSASYARVAEAHGGAEETDRLVNASLRHAGRHGFGELYALAEASRRAPEEGTALWSVLGEARLEAGRHQPYLRVEYATRPEYHRVGAPGSDGFFRYDHAHGGEAASRWLIQSLGYGFEATRGAVSVRPFVEAQHHRVRAERGGFDPVAVFGGDRFWSLSAGVRIFLGGDPMRMGGYGVLDPVSSTLRDASGEGGHAAH